MFDNGGLLIVYDCMTLRSNLCRYVIDEIEGYHSI